MAAKVVTKGWSREFDDPIPLPRGRQFVTLKDAGTYITKLPKTEQKLEEWQTAMQALLLVVEQNGPTMFARIWRYERASPQRRARVQSRSQRHALRQRKLKRDE
jgi:hypothetical protein